MAEVKFQEGESIESASATLQAQGAAGRHHQGHQETLLLPEAGDKRRAKQALARKRNRKKMRRETE